MTTRLVAVSRPSERSVDKPGVAWVATCIAAFLIILIPLYLLNAETQHGIDAERPLDAMWVLQAAIIIWSGLRIAQLYKRGQPALMALTFWIYVYVFLGVAPFAQVFTGIVPGGGSMDRTEQVTGSIIVLVGVASYELGRAIAAEKVDELVEPPATTFNMRRVWVLAVVGLVFAVAYVAIIGPSSLFQFRSDRADVSQESFGGSQISSIFSALATVPTLVSLLGFIDAKRQGAKGNWLVISVLLVTILVLTNPIASSRFWFGVVVGSLAIMVFSLAKTPRRFRILLVAVVAILLVAFPYADRFRSANSLSAAESSPSLATLLSGKMDYDSFPQIALTQRYVEAEGHTLGSQALGALVAPLPRAWWPDKPQDTGIVLAEYARYGFTSISAPLWSEAWIDGGWPWLAIVFLGLGLLSRRLDSRYIRSSRYGYGLWNAAVPVFALYQIMTLRGSFLQQTPRLVLFALFFWFVASVSQLPAKRAVHRKATVVAQRSPKVARGQSKGQS